MRIILAKLVFLAWIPVCSHPVWAQPPGAGIESGSPQPKLAIPPTKDDQRGTEDSPFVVDTKGHKNTSKEAAEEKADTNWKHNVDTWTIGLALVVALFT